MSQTATNAPLHDIETRKIEVKYAVILTLILLGFALPTHANAKGGAQSFTGDKLLALCNSPRQSDKALCRYYIVGVASGIKLGLYMARETPAQQRPCLPHLATGSMLESIVVPGMERDFAEHPSLAKEDAVFAISANLSDVFPCGGKN